MNLMKFEQSRASKRAPTVPLQTLYDSLENIRHELDEMQSICNADLMRVFPNRRLIFAGIYSPHKRKQQTAITAGLGSRSRIGECKGDSIMGNQAGESEISKYVMTKEEMANQDARHSAANEAWAPAPSSAGQRMWDVTKEGVEKIPQGFVNSLDYHNILPNVGMGFAIGAGTRLLLAESGPVAKVAGTLLGAYFIGKPLVETYSHAYTAQTMADMHQASDIFGNAIGGLPVAMVEGGIGARLGAGAMGKVLSTRAAQPFVEWKANQYAKLDARFDNAYASAHNFAFENFGIGRPVMKAATVSSIIPPYLLEELAKRNPNNPAYLETIKKTQAMGRVQPNTSRVAGDVTEGTGAREVYDAKGQETNGVKVRSEGQAKIGDVEVDNVYDYTGDVRDYYKVRHNRNSIDGKGMNMRSTVNYGQNYENAFWNGERMTYGRPGADSPFKTFVLRDVTGHEITHGVTEFESNLVYRGQPGALNESHSDVFGALITQRALGQKAADANWLVGDGIWKENVKGRALRDMQNPGTAYDDPMLGKDPQPAHMKDYVNTRRDNGGVHLNSGIPNKAFVLFAKEMGGLAYEKPGEIWYKARALAGDQPSFAQFAYYTIEAAKQLGYNEAVPKLQKAWDGVGITPNKTAVETTPPVVAPEQDHKRVPQT